MSSSSNDGVTGTGTSASTSTSASKHTTPTATPNQLITFGYKTNCVVGNIRDALDGLKAQGLSFAALPLFHPRFRRDRIGISDSRVGPKTRSDRALESSKWVAHVVGCISPWIDLDSETQHSMQSSEAALKEEIMWGCHLGVQSILLPAPKKTISPNYARCINQLSSPLQYQQIWIRIPLLAPLLHNDVTTTDGMSLWCHLHRMCNYSPKICVCLEITHELPDDIEQSILRWPAESLKAVVINTNVFLTNRNGFPVLPKLHQAVMDVLLKYRLHVIFDGKPCHGDANSYLFYAQYIQHLQSKALKPMTDEERYTISYQDTLQSPLQPLMDNLEAQTYEVFERDPVKYEKYEEAIRKALPVARSRQCEPRDVICMVVGAGRGPLVACCLSASAATGVPVLIYAVEKNDNAIITLRNRSITERWHNVKIVHSDMRYFQTDQLADILISELLGSWGDNELSPECLDGAERFMAADGISIPSSYTSFIAPLSSSRLWMCARDMPDGKGLETPFVVKFHNCHQTATSMPLFTFLHPNPRKHPNTRYDCLSFQVDIDTTIHGFAGTFESILFDDVLLSINPQTHSENMFSWFPLFLPLVQPVSLKKGETVTICVWRCVDARRVWYEWCLLSPVVLPIQNPSGKSYWIGLH